MCLVNSYLVSMRYRVPLLKRLSSAVMLPTLLLSSSPLVAEQSKFATEEKLSSSFQDREPGLNVPYHTYILGAGDRLHIELLDLPELSGAFTIGPDGTLYLPRLRAIQVEGLTIEELRLFLTEQFRSYVRQPEVFITPLGYRPVRVYVGGEVARPGYYTIREQSMLEHSTSSRNRSGQERKPKSASVLFEDLQAANQPGKRGIPIPAPTLFDALQAARGVTPFSQLDTVQITRKRPLSQGGGKVQAKVNFLRFVSYGDEEVNIRLYDDDTIFVSKSQDVMRDQLLAASRTNLSPDFIEVFVSGRVTEPGPHQLPQGASLNQAIASAGGPELLRGRVEFLRFTQEGDTDRRIFAYNPKASSGNYRNPVLMPGDVVRINESIVSASFKLINEVTMPAVGLYSIYSIFND